MPRSKKLGLRALGLCAIALGLMASAAQAEPNAKWLANGANVLDLAPSVIASLENNHGSLLTKIINILTHILCTAIVLINIKLELEGKFLGKAAFSGCDTLLTSLTSVSAPCLPKTAGLSDLIETLLVVGLIKLHLTGVGTNVETLVWIKADVAGQNLVDIETSEECAVGQKIPITGELVLRDLGGISTSLVTHLFEESPLSTLKASGQKAILDGAGNASLTGAHNGLTWSGIPGPAKP